MLHPFKIEKQPDLELFGQVGSGSGKIFRVRDRIRPISHLYYFCNFVIQSIGQIDFIRTVVGSSLENLKVA
jgi:hypothetical protein